MPYYTYSGWATVVDPEQPSTHKALCSHKPPKLMLAMHRLHTEFTDEGHAAGLLSAASVASARNASGGPPGRAAGVSGVGWGGVVADGPAGGEILQLLS